MVEKNFIRSVTYRCVNCKTSFLANTLFPYAGRQRPWEKFKKDYKEV